MTFDEFYFIEGQPVQGKMRIIDPVAFTPEYPNELLTYQQLPITPLDLASVPAHKEKLHHSDKEEKKKCSRNKMFKLMLISQMMMNSQK